VIGAAAGMEGEVSAEAGGGDAGLVVDFCDFCDLCDRKKALASSCLAMFTLRHQGVPPIMSWSSIVCRYD